MVYGAIKQLVQYGLDTGLITDTDAIYARNQILDALHMEEYEEPENDPGKGTLEEILKELLDYACENGVIEDGIASRDLFDTRLMNCLMPRPSEVSATFWKLYEEKGSERATEYFYKLSQDSDYIRRYRVCKDQKWVTSTPYGNLDITINLSKPEKDPRAIAKAKLAKQSGYPKCLLCMENEGYAGRLNHPADKFNLSIAVTFLDCRTFVTVSSLRSAPAETPRSLRILQQFNTHQLFSQLLFLRLYI